MFVYSKISGYIISKPSFYENQAFIKLQCLFLVKFHDIVSNPSFYENQAWFLLNMISYITTTFIFTDRIWIMAGGNKIK